MAHRMLISALLATLAIASPLEKRATVQNPANNFACPSSAHPNPVILFHGLGATYYEDLNQLEAYLKSNGFCTFSLTYGAHSVDTAYVGGLIPIDQSSVELAAFVKQVQSQTGAAKVDLLGHSEGAFQTLYVTKFGGVANIVDKVFAIAPPTHGTTFANLYDIALLGGNVTTDLTQTILKEFGCPACADLVTGGAAVVKLNQGAIAQPGVSYTILASKYDELVTPAPTTSFVNEAGVRDITVQQYCPNDPVGHISEAYDQNVWQLVKNTLSGSTAGPSVCTYGSPGR